LRRVQGNFSKEERGPCSEGDPSDTGREHEKRKGDHPKAVIFSILLCEDRRAMMILNFFPSVFVPFGRFPWVWKTLRDYCGATNPKSPAKISLAGGVCV
jgi:hypothetical protein